MQNKKYDLAVIVGRFQTPYLHRGHQALFHQALRMSDNLLICIGSTGMNPTEKDPLSYAVRKNMINDWYHKNAEELGYNVYIEEQRDQPFSDASWNESLEEKIQHYVKGGSVVLVAGRDSFLPHYLGDHDTHQIDQVDEYSATKVRDQINPAFATLVADQHLKWFHKGVIYAHNTKPYPNIYPTVDAIVWKYSSGEGVSDPEGYYVALGRKKGESDWRTPGGFVDVSDVTYEGAVKREVWEECGMIEVDKPVYVASSFIDDRRYKHVRDKVFTTFYSLQYIFGSLKPGDDLESLEWFAIDDIDDLPMIHEHKHFIKHWYERSILKRSESDRKTT